MNTVKVSHPQRSAQSLYKLSDVRKVVMSQLHSEHTKGVCPLGCLCSAPFSLTNMVYTLRQPPQLSHAAPDLVECHLWVVLISNQTDVAASYENSALKCVSEDILRRGKKLLLNLFSF